VCEKKENSSDVGIKIGATKQFSELTCNRYQERFKEIE